MFNYVHFGCQVFGPARTMSIGRAAAEDRSALVHGSYVLTPEKTN